ncbi:MAG: hypothetical protein ACLFTS_01565 [Candidatus Paceibacterota bacterium]
MKDERTDPRYSISEEREMYLDGHAYSLIAYTAKSKSFSSFLKTYIDVYLTDHSYGELRSENRFSKSLIPRNDQNARERTFWLLSEITLEGRETKAGYTLKTWSKMNEDPQDLVIGIVGLAIIGPTFGIINKKKKLDSLQIIFSEKDLEKCSVSDYIGLAHSASLELVSESLALVDGNFHRLEPDLQYWFVSDRSLRLGVMKEKDLLDVSGNLNEQGIPHCYSKDANGRSAISISPAVRFNIYEDLDAEDLGQVSTIKQN